MQIQAPFKTLVYSKTLSTPLGLLLVNIEYSKSTGFDHKLQEQQGRIVCVNLL